MALDDAFNSLCKALYDIYENEKTKLKNQYAHLKSDEYLNNVFENIIVIHIKRGNESMSNKEQSMSQEKKSIDKEEQKMNEEIEECIDSIDKSQESIDDLQKEIKELQNAAMTVHNEVNNAILSKNKEMSKKLVYIKTLHEQLNVLRKISNSYRLIRSIEQ